MSDKNFKVSDEMLVAINEGAEMGMGCSAAIGAIGLITKNTTLLKAGVVGMIAAFGTYAGTDAVLEKRMYEEDNLYIDKEFDDDDDDDYEDDFFDDDEEFKEAEKTEEKENDSKSAEVSASEGNKNDSSSEEKKEEN